MVTIMHKGGSSCSQYDQHRPLVSRPSQLTHVTVCVLMLGLWSGFKALNHSNTVNSPASFLKCLYQARKVNGHVFVCQGYRFCLFLRFLYLILELYRQCGLFVFHFIRERVLHKNVIFSAHCKIIDVKSGTFLFSLFDIPNA